MAQRSGEVYHEEDVEVQEEGVDQASPRKARRKSDYVKVDIRRSLYESLRVIAGYNGRTVPEVVGAILESKAFEVEQALKSIDLGAIVDF